MSDFENENEKTNNENVTSHVPASEDVKYGGYICALVMGIIAAVLIGLNLSMINDSSKYYPKLFLFGIVFLGLTIGFLVCPGARVVKDLAGYDSKEKISTVFWKADTVEHIIRIVITLICTGFGIYIMVEEKFYLCGILTLALITGGAAVLIIKTIVQWIIDASKTVEEKEEIAKDETKYSSVVYRILSIVLSALIGFICAFSLYERLPLFASDFGLKGFENAQRIHHEKWADKFLKENIDKEVPFRIITSDEDETISFLIDIYELTETPDDENDFISLLKAPLSKLISYVMADDERILAFSEDKGYSEYNKKSLEKNSCVQKYFEENPDALETDFPEFNSILKYLDQLNSEDSEFVEKIISSEAENLLKYANMWCFVTEPYLDCEFICLWDISSFTEYYNKTYGTSYTEDELITEFDNGKFKKYDIVCTDVGPALYYFYRQQKYTCGLIINFGTENDDCYSGIAMDKIMSQLCQNEEYLQRVKEFLELEDEDIEKDLAESKNWWDEDL